MHGLLCVLTRSCPTLCDPTDYSPPGSSVHGDSPGKNTRVGCHALLQGIFLTQGSNLGLLHCRWILYQLSHRGSPWTTADQGPPSMEFSRQEYWGGLPFPFPGDLPDPGIKPRSPALRADALPSEPPGRPPTLDNIPMIPTFRFAT